MIDRFIDQRRDEARPSSARRTIGARDRDAIGTNEERGKNTDEGRARAADSRAKSSGENRGGAPGAERWVAGCLPIIHARDRSRGGWVGG